MCPNPCGFWPYICYEDVALQLVDLRELCLGVPFVRQFEEGRFLRDVCHFCFFSSLTCSECFWWVFFSLLELLYQCITTREVRQQGKLRIEDDLDD
jgi:hypothetical protein